VKKEGPEARFGSQRDGESRSFQAGAVNPKRDDKLKTFEQGKKEERKKRAP